MNVYKLTLIAIFAAVGVVGRTVFVYLPNVQPVTALIIICGLFMGPQAALILAILVTFLSNMMLGMGIWTIWQILSWGCIGIASGYIGKVYKQIPLYLVMIIGLVSGYVYGFLISLTTYQVAGHFWPYYIMGLPFDTYHAVGNVIFIALFYPILKVLLEKYAQDRFHLLQK